MSKLDKSMDAVRAAQETIKDAARAMGKIEARDNAKKTMEKDSPQTLVQKVKSLFIAARRINKIYDAANTFYENVEPYVGPVLRPVGMVAGGLKDAFVWAAFERDEKGMKSDAQGDPVFSPGRLARTFATAAALGLGTIAAAHSAYYYSTQFSETVYVTGKSTIQKGELYEFTGCDSLPCSTKTDNGKYYNIEQSFFSPRLIYPEQDVYANIPQQGGVCDVQGYGIYFKDLK